MANAERVRSMVAKLRIVKVGPQAIMLHERQFFFRTNDADNDNLTNLSQLLRPKSEETNGITQSMYAICMNTCVPHTLKQWAIVIQATEY